MAWVVGDPVAGAQMGGPVLEGATENQCAFEALVGMDGGAAPSGQAGQIQAGSRGVVSLDDRHPTAAQTAPEPVPLGLGGQMGTEGLQGIRGGRDGLVPALALAAGFTVAEVQAQEDGPEGIAAGV
jgi:hypothetical protein